MKTLFVVGIVVGSVTVVGLGGAVIAPLVNPDLVNPISNFVGTSCNLTEEQKEAGFTCELVREWQREYDSCPILEINGECMTEEESDAWRAELGAEATRLQKEQEAILAAAEQKDAECAAIKFELIMVTRPVLHDNVPTGEYTTFETSRGEGDPKYISCQQERDSLWQRVEDNIKEQQAQSKKYEEKRR